MPNDPKQFDLFDDEASEPADEVGENDAEDAPEEAQADANDADGQDVVVKADRLQSKANDFLLQDPKMSVMRMMISLRCGFTRAEKLIANTGAIPVATQPDVE